MSPERKTPTPSRPAAENTVLQEGRRPQATAASLPRTTPPAVRNAFGPVVPSPFGQTPGSIKRHGTPVDSRHAKLPKLGFQSNLEAFQHDLREDLRVVIRAECDRVQRELRQDLSAPHEQFKAQLGMLKPEIGQLRTELKLLQTQAATNGDAQRTLVKGHRDDMQQDIVSTEQRICNTMDRRITELATRQDAYMTASQNAGYEMQQEILSSEQRSSLPWSKDSRPLVQTLMPNFSLCQQGSSKSFAVRWSKGSQRSVRTLRRRFKLCRQRSSN